MGNKKKKKNKKWYRAELAKANEALEYANVEIETAKIDATEVNAVIAPLAAAIEGVFDDCDADRPLFIYTIKTCGGSDMVKIEDGVLTVKNATDLVTL